MVRWPQGCLLSRRATRWAEEPPWGLRGVLGSCQGDIVSGAPKRSVTADVPPGTRGLLERAFGAKRVWRDRRHGWQPCRTGGQRWRASVQQSPAAAAQEHRGLIRATLGGGAYESNADAAKAISPTRVLRIRQMLSPLGRRLTGLLTGREEVCNAFVRLGG